MMSSCFFPFLSLKLMEKTWSPFLYRSGDQGSYQLGAVFPGLRKRDYSLDHGQGEVLGPRFEGDDLQWDGVGRTRYISEGCEVQCNTMSGKEGGHTFPNDIFREVSLMV